jgi:hypothetical protein
VRRQSSSTFFVQVGLVGLSSAACLGALASPLEAASAARSARANRGSPALENVRIELRGTNGYAISLGTHSLGNSPPKVSVSVRRGGKASTEYDVRGNVTRSRVAASFGRFGRIDLRFHPSGRLQRHRQRNCDGSISILKRRLGIFTGTLRFRGEDGYTEVSSKRVKGSAGNFWVGLGVDVGPVCGPAPRRKEVRTVELNVMAAHPDRGFSAFSQPDAHKPVEKARVLFGAGTAERVGRISIYRTAIALGPASDFLFDDGVFSSATVTPPAPFTGTATFSRSPDGSTSWSGNLEVGFPGLDSLPLTGPEFKSELGAFEPLL